MHKQPDSEIEQLLLRELSLSFKLRSREVCVCARNGVVKIKGSALSCEEKAAIEESVRRAQGVLGVVNEIMVKSGATLIIPISESVYQGRVLLNKRIARRVAV